MLRNLNTIRQTNGFIGQAPKIAKKWNADFKASSLSGTGFVGKIIPVFYREMMPGEKFQLKHTTTIQFTPFRSNLFHQIEGVILTYFVPYRLCAFKKYKNSDSDPNKSSAHLARESTTMSNNIENGNMLSINEAWEYYITGGLTGNDNQGINSNKLNTINLKTLQQQAGGKADSLKYTLADYFAMKCNGFDETYDNPPNNLLWAAYNTIYNECYRNPDFTPQRLINDNTVATAYWESDRFTHARKAQMRGPVPSVPLSDDLGTILHLKQTLTHDITQVANKSVVGTIDAALTNSDYVNAQNSSPISTDPKTDGIIALTGVNSPETTTKGKVRIEPHEVNISMENVGINLNDLLTNLMIMKYEINNERMRPYYKDQLYYRFGVNVQDSRLDIPEHIGTQKIAIGTQTVTATASTEQESQGNITSQAWGVGNSGKAGYEVPEHGVVMSLMIIRPKAVYEEGMERFWFGDRDRFTFPTPEMVDLPDVPIYKGELVYTGNKEKDKETFAYQAIYDEYRTMENKVCADFRPSMAENGLPSYTLARFFDNQAPELNDSFLKCNPDMDRIKQFTSSGTVKVPDFMFFVRTEMKDAQALPLINDPVKIL